MKRIALFSAFALFLLSAVSASAQEKKYYTPQAGDWAIGVVFNPASMSSQMLAQPKPSPHQMFMLSQDPVAAIRVKYRVSKKWAIRASVGLNGSIVNYREYVPDDMALALNPDTQNQVVDEIQSQMNSGSLMLGCELMCGTKAVRFIVGADLLYSIAGGHLLFNYGNKMTDLNRIPSSMPMTSEMKDGSALPTAVLSTDTTRAISPRSDSRWIWVSRFSLPSVFPPA